MPETIAESIPVDDGDDNRNEQVRCIEDFASELSLSESDARRLLVAAGVVITTDYLDRECAPMSAVQAVTESSAYLPARVRALTEGTYGRPVDSPGTRQMLRADRMRLLASYEPYVDELEQIHRRYRQSAHCNGFEASPMAQYLLLSRAIALLRALISALKAGHFYALGLIRDNNECLDLAQYFRITEDTERGRLAVRRWYRQARWPSHRLCRSEIAQFAARAIGLPAENHRALHAELYRRKSHHIHPSFLAIRDVTAFRKDHADGDVTVTHVTYGPDDEERRLWQGADFLKAGALLPTTQVMSMSLCASIGIKQGDSNRLLAMAKELSG